MKSEFLAAFNKDEKAVKKYIMKDSAIKKLYLRMQKNRLIKEHYQQKIEGILPKIPHHHKHGGVSHGVTKDDYRVYLPQDVIDHAFESSSSICFGSFNQKDFKFEELKSTCSSHSHGEQGDQIDLDANDENNGHHNMERITYKDLFILSHKGKFIQNWERFDTLCCLYSGYLYAWVACFGITPDSKTLFINTVFVESVFAISIITRFLTDYIP